MSPGRGKPGRASGGLGQGTGRDGLLARRRTGCFSISVSKQPERKLINKF